MTSDPEFLDDGAPRGEARPSYDETELPDAALRNATRTEATVDRGAFDPRGKLQSAGKLGLGVVLVGAGFLGFVAYALTSRPATKPAAVDDSTFRLDDKTAATTARQAAQAAQTPDQLPPPGLTIGGAPPQLTAVPGGRDLSQPGVPAPVAGNAPQPNNGQLTPLQQRMLEAERARLAAIQREKQRQDTVRRAPLMAVSSATGQSQQGGGLTIGGQSGGGEGGAAQGGAPAGASRNELGERLNSAIDIQRVRARNLGTRNFLVTAGGQIPCVLQTALDSTLPGLTSCVVPVNVWSDNGNVILMGKGTRVLGEYQGGTSQGQYRIFILWNRAITPEGVAINLGSPAGDQLGRSGLPGAVDSFFWQRFGSGLLLSVVSDAASAAADRAAGISQTIRAPNAAAALAVEDGVKIKPRLRANQGAEMTIFVAKDLDFSGVYSLRLKR